MQPNPQAQIDPPTRAGAPEKVFSGAIGAMNSVGTLGIFAIMILVSSDIAMRFLFNAPIRGVAEIVSLAITGIVFLQIAHTLKVGSFTRAELLLGPLQKLAPRVAASMEALFCLVGAGVFAALFYGGLKPFGDAWANGYYLGAAGDFTAPTWPVKLLILVGSAAIVLQFLIQAAKAARMVLAPGRSQ